MNKMNRKGFTMVELLSVVVILGILLSISVVAYSKYKDKTSKNSYKMMHENAALAAENYFMDVPGSDNVTIADLVRYDYLATTVDPWDNEKICVGEVSIDSKIEKQDDAIELYKYKVQLKCSQGCTCLIYPDKTPCDCAADYQG